MNDLLFSVLVGVLPFVPFFLAMMFGLFGKTRPVPRLRWCCGLAALGSLAAILLIVALRMPVEPLTPAAPMAPRTLPPAPPLQMN